MAWAWASSSHLGSRTPCGWSCWRCSLNSVPAWVSDCWCSSPCPCQQQHRVLRIHPHCSHICHHLLPSHCRNSLHYKPVLSASVVAREVLPGPAFPGIVGGYRAVGCGVGVGVAAGGSGCGCPHPRQWHRRPAENLLSTEAAHGQALAPLSGQPAQWSPAGFRTVWVSVSASEVREQEQQVGFESPNSVLEGSSRARPLGSRVWWKCSSNSQARIAIWGLHQSRRRSCCDTV
mmetsp:Transcript_76210/g.166338  ORF Transcript_76210/g.166338 Transcript_76210/m.166338 type:complete len:232 (-) Transcript_76210:673-1368(-)